MFSFLFLFFAIIFYVLMMNIKFLYDNIGHRFEGLFNIFNDVTETDGSTSIRINMIIKGLNFFTNKPLFGYGLDNYQIIYGLETGTIVYSHNNYVEMLVNLGLIGFMLYYVFFILILKLLKNTENDENNLKYFFIALILVYFIFELGAVTYDLYYYQVFVGLATVYLSLKRGKKNEKNIKTN